MPAPSQVPSVPQPFGSVTVHSTGSVGVTPAGMGVQRPSALGRPHDLHVSVQADSQHTPSTQNPDWHSSSQPQACDWGLVGEAPDLVQWGGGGALVPSPDRAVSTAPSGGAVAPSSLPPEPA